MIIPRYPSGPPRGGTPIRWDPSGGVYFPGEKPPGSGPNVISPQKKSHFFVKLSANPVDVRNAGT